MGVISKPLVTAKYAAATETTQYTAPPGTRTIIDKFTGYNSDTSAALLTVKLVPNAVAAGLTNVIVAKYIGAGETYLFPEIVGQVLEAGGFVSVLSGTASKVVIRVSGREVTQ